MISMKDFIKQNRTEIDKVLIRQGVPRAGIDDGERELWIENDEGLYLWAKSAGVKGMA